MKMQNKHKKVTLQIISNVVRMKLSQFNPYTPAGVLVCATISNKNKVTATYQDRRNNELS